MPIIAAAIIGGATIAAGASAASAASKANRRNVQLAEDTNAAQIELANTAHQREVKDLRAAGLNPILSGTGGAGAGVPNLNVPVVGSVDYGSALGKGVSSAVMARQQLALGEQNLKLLKEQTAATHEDYLRKAEETEITARANAQDESRQRWMLGDPFAGADRQRQLFSAELEQKLASRDATVQDVKNARQQLQNLVREFNIGGSAEAQSQILEKLYKSNPGELLKYLELFKQLLPWGNLPRLGR